MGITCGSYPKSATVLPSSTPIMKATVRVKDIANFITPYIGIPARTNQWIKVDEAEVARGLTICFYT
jgi:hypothetical protein